MGRLDCISKLEICDVGIQEPWFRHEFLNLGPKTITISCLHFPFGYFFHLFETIHQHLVSTCPIPFFFLVLHRLSPPSFTPLLAMAQYFLSLILLLAHAPSLSHLSLSLPSSFLNISAYSHFLFFFTSFSLFPLSNILLVILIFVFVLSLFIFPSSFLYISAYFHFLFFFPSFSFLLLS